MSRQVHEICAENCEEQYWPAFYKPFLQAFSDLQDELDVDKIRFTFVLPNFNGRDYEFTYCPLNQEWDIQNLTSTSWISSRNC
jgi:hypothetical protein